MYWRNENDTGRLYNCDVSNPSYHIRTIENRNHFKIHRREASQLKFVNHELYTEIRGLEVSYNTIVFDDIEGLAHLLGICPTSYHLRLRTLEVKTLVYRHDSVLPTGNADAVEDVFRFCNRSLHVLARNEFPQSRIRFRFYHLDLLWK